MNKKKISIHIDILLYTYMHIYAIFFTYSHIHTYTHTFLMLFSSVSTSIYPSIHKCFVLSYVLFLVLIPILIIINHFVEHVGLLVVIALCTGTRARLYHSSTLFLKKSKRFPSSFKWDKQKFEQSRIQNKQTNNNKNSNCS